MTLGPATLLIINIALCVVHQVRASILSAVTIICKISTQKKMLSKIPLQIKNLMGCWVWSWQGFFFFSFCWAGCHFSFNHKIQDRIVKAVQLYKLYICNKDKALDHLHYWLYNIQLYNGICGPLVGCIAEVTLGVLGVDSYAQ